MKISLCTAIVGLSLFAVGTLDRASATTVSGVYSNTLDTSSLGGTPTDAVAFTFAYDTNGPFVDLSPDFRAYTGIAGTLTIGSQSLTYSGGHLLIANNSSGLDEFSVEFDTNASPTLPNSSVNGTIYGVTPRAFLFAFLDDNQLMLSSLLAPTSLDTSLTTRQFEQLLLSDGQGPFSESGAALTLAETPLPATLPLFTTALGVLGLLGFRRKKKAAALTA
jgi:hypothetical protein